jgi:glycosyltransferase involved in cell wall biosynthesis
VGEVVDDGNSGLLVRPRDADAIAASVLRFLDNPSWARQVGLAGRASVIPKYTVGRLVGDMEKLYLDLAREKGLAA